MFQKFRDLWKTMQGKKITYYYPVNEAEYEQNPIKTRTCEVSQFQDEARDPETRSPERDVFDYKTLEHGQPK